MMNMALSGKSHAGIRTSDFDEGEVASAKPRRGSLLYRMVRSQTVALALVLVTMSAYSATYYTKKDDPGGTYSFYNKGSWTSGEAPTAGNDYIATNLVRACGGRSDSFAGESLQIGEVGGEAPSHFDEYVRCCREGGRARSDFLWSAHMSDAVLLGGACERFPNRTLRWDPKARTIDDAVANAALHSDYRDGWKVQGLG